QENEHHSTDKFGQIRHHIHNNFPFYYLFTLKIKVVLVCRPQSAFEKPTVFCPNQKTVCGFLNFNLV
ncbi:MAG: hypothetical protein IKA90_05750, partial [Clostridia bacterium]|nr:hypothetical protein [Clostridia bacterium]